MMRSKGLLSPYGIVTAALLLIAGLLVAALCLRTAVIEALPAASPSVLALAPHAPGPVLDRAATALVAQHGILSTDTLAAVRRAAAADPLDARAFLILGHQQLLDREPARAVRTLERGQQLDPRNPVIHLLLVDRYLRTGRYADAAAQFSISARLLGSAEGPIAAAMAQMSLSPETRNAMRYTLSTDPSLEKAVLVSLARSDTPPATIFALASPVGLQDAGSADGFGPVLIDRLAHQGRYGAARAVWTRLYGISASEARAPVYDASFRGLPGSAPFNWTLTAGSIGAADLRGGTMAIDYYGRDTGPLAEQLLVLAPGAYRFGIVVEGGKTASGPTMAWTLQCVGDAKSPLMTLPISGIGAPHRSGAIFTVPAGCPAQRLVLAGTAGEFPSPIELGLRDLTLQPTGTQS